MNTQFKPYTDNDYVVSTWFERDRAHIRLETRKGRVVFELWDDEVLDAIESGYLRVPRVPRPTDADWHSSAVEYARELRMIP